MKANRKYNDLNKLEIMGTEIKSDKCTQISIKYTIDARHILLAIVDLFEEEKPTRQTIEACIRRELRDRGFRWFESPIEYGEDDGNRYNLKKEIEKALPIGQKLFPEFFDTPNSVKFIKDLI